MSNSSVGCLAALFLLNGVVLSRGIALYAVAPLGALQIFSPMF